jgi:hypothetical protein
MKKLTLFLLSLTIPSLSLPTQLYAEGSIAQEKASQLAQFSQAELEQMLAPIALYPDSVLTHILIASTYPLEIIQANRWVEKNSELDAADALTKVENKEWDPSVKALVPFPRILERLSDDLEWTQKLGDAFLQDEESVLRSIQSLRKKADRAGNLDKMDNMQITREDENIIIQPIEREVVYVPYYDTRVVYGSWHWDHYQPVYWDWSWHSHHNHHSYHYTPHHGLFSWHPRIHISTHYFHSAFNWHNHHVVVVDRHHYNSRRYQHREHIIANANARRWSHNPTHRRGVAYRNEQIRERFNSNRPSVSQTRIVRHNERTNVSNRRIDSSRTDSRANDKPTTRSVNVNTRQERLRQQLDNNRNRESAVRERSTQTRSSQSRNSQDSVVNERSNDNRASNNREIINQNTRATRTTREQNNRENSNTERRNNQTSRQEVDNDSRRSSKEREKSTTRQSNDDDGHRSRNKVTRSESRSSESRANRSERRSSASNERRSSRSSRRDDR